MPARPADERIGRSMTASKALGEVLTFNALVVNMWSLAHVAPSNAQTLTGSFNAMLVENPTGLLCGSADVINSGIGALFTGDAAGAGASLT